MPWELGFTIVTSRSQLDVNAHVSRSNTNSFAAFEEEDCCRFDLLLRPATTSYLFPVRERFQIPSIPDLNILAAANTGSQGQPWNNKQEMILVPFGHRQ